MLRPANELQVQTREAIESSIMEKIDSASQKGETFIDVKNTEIPDWLLVKLRVFGYIIEKGIEMNTIYWGVGNAE